MYGVAILTEKNCYCERFDQLLLERLNFAAAAPSGSSPLRRLKKMRTARPGGTGRSLTQ